MGKLADRIAERSRARIEALAFDIADRGFAAAEDYCRMAFFEADGPLADLRLNCAIALVEHMPGDAALADPAVDSILRQHCSNAIAMGEALSQPLRDFAAQALLTAPAKAGKGKPAAVSAWHKMVVIQLIRDLRDAGIPAYHGEGQDADALFYATDAVAAVLGVKERTARGWWKDRGDI